ncbi:Fic/DOC family N-terminal domain-containing protein [Candidatus Glomeribacter gigasporarum]|uniref:Fic/DOC family N-terminal domain-containing protein n=1 Tax=Candidatus Glomeribacter gigasporarum TaxID=132144 RepID=UPI0023AE74F3|nr:Fic/DOC family N-terminal domain-containing protein [Candidatus Glomeribacter gigasporarum]
MFVVMFARHESTLSSQVEGTHSTLEDVLEFEVSGEGHRKPKDAQEIVNYVRAMNYGNDAGIG